MKKKTTFALRARPEFDESEVEQTIEFCCSSLLGVAVAVNQMLRFPIRLQELADEFTMLS